MRNWVVSLLTATTAVGCGLSRNTPPALPNAAAVTAVETQFPAAVQPDPTSSDSLPGANETLTPVKDDPTPAGTQIPSTSPSPAASVSPVASVSPTPTKTPTAPVVATPPVVVTCNEISGQPDVTPLIAACIERVASGGKVELPPGQHRMVTPLRIKKTIALTTAGHVPGQGARCSVGDASCATLNMEPASPHFSSSNQESFSVYVEAAKVHISHLVFNMHLAVPGVRMLAPGGRIDFSAFTNARRTAVEVTPPAGPNFVSVHNLFINNGEHARTQSEVRWADGLTLHDAANAQVVSNEFVDNTDVALIFGGCTNCAVSDNVIRNSGNQSRASFAALAIYSWPNSSGDYAGTNFTRNLIECANHTCGVGIYIGNLAWNDGATPRNARVSGNTIRHAQLGMYIDHAKDMIITDDNSFDIPAGGPFQSKCGKQYSTAVLALSALPSASGRIRLGLGETAPNLFNNHKVILDLGCVPNYPWPW